MPILHGIASAASSICQSAIPHEAEFDTPALAGASFFAVRANTVEQAFSRRFGAIDYKVERQRLHREDVRDLVELTTNRMNIYHLVGTLLLAFCMKWYTDSTVWELPVWYMDLFLISNYGAVGYLIMCVWLAMYAAVAARSIGTRLLTSQMRLALPTKSQLDRIKNPIFFNTRDVIRRKFGRSNSDPDLAVSREPADCVSDHAEVPDEDHNAHFRLFLSELPRWLVYDTWARVCMSFGMNQMLQSLSYFSMGSIWSKTPMGAIMSFMAITMLANFVLRLDVGEMDDVDYVSHILLDWMPPTCASVLLICQSLYPDLFGEERHVEALMVFICFCAHAAWLKYLLKLFGTAGEQNGRFQPGSFANVLEWIPQNENLKMQKGNDEDQSESENQDVDKASASNADDQQASQGIGHKQMVGGNTPGTWMRTKQTDISTEMEDLTSTKHLPVRILRYFSYTVIGWWICAGAEHALTIAFDEHNHMKDFTGSNDMQPLTAKLVQWPQPARLFKVAGLYCSDSQLWVSNGFSMFAMAQGVNTSMSSLQFVKDGQVDAVICGSHGCDTLSPLDGVGPWVLDCLEPCGHAATQVPIPPSWRRLAGTWADCPSARNATCTSAWLAGWDGSKVFVSALELDASSKTWATHTRFQVDPVVGLCAGRQADCDRGLQNYSDVRALQINKAANSLMVLLGAGILDVWDLSKGVVARRMHLNSSITSMCRSGDRVFLSNQEGNSPSLLSLDLPPTIASVLSHPHASVRTSNERARPFTSHTQAQPSQAHRHLKFLTRQTAMTPQAQVLSRKSSGQHVAS